MMKVSFIKVTGKAVNSITHTSLITLASRVYLNGDNKLQTHRGSVNLQLGFNATKQLAHFNDNKIQLYFHLSN